MRRQFTVFILYLVLTIVFTWPLCLHLRTSLPLGNYDIWQNYWNFWWWKTAVWHNHQSPYFTPLLYYPFGAALGCHTHSEANILLTLPLNIVCGVPAAMNIALLCSFLFAGFGTYLLAKQYVESNAAAFLAGLVFAFYPQHIEQSLEHLNLASIQAMPLFLWALVLLIRNGGWKWSVATGLLFALNALFGWHNALLLLPAAIVLALFELRTRNVPFAKVFAKLSGAAAIAAIVLIPFLYPFIRDLNLGATSLEKNFRPRDIDPIALITPHMGHPFWGKAFAPVRSAESDDLFVGSTGYLGIAALALSFGIFLPLKRSDSSKWLWLILFVFYVLLSLGSQSIWGMPMPFRWLREFPLFGLIRIPNRFLVVAMLSMSVLTVIGASNISNLLSEKLKKPFYVFAATFIIIDFLWLPYPVQNVQTPEWMPTLQNVLQNVPRQRSVLDIPTSRQARASKDMFLQTVHGRPITGGYISTRLRDVDARLLQCPILQSIFQMKPPGKLFNERDLKTLVNDFQIGVVVVHLDRTSEAIRAKLETIKAEYPEDFYHQRLYHEADGISSKNLMIMRNILRQSFGTPVVSADNSVEIYVVR